MLNNNLRNYLNGIALDASQWSLINYIFQNKFNGKLEPSQVQPFYYMGALVGSELTTYLANKIYNF